MYHSGFRIPDSGFRIPDSVFGIRYSVFGIRYSVFGIRYSQRHAGREFPCIDSSELKKNWLTNRRTRCCESPIPNDKFRLMYLEPLGYCLYGMAPLQSLVTEPIQRAQATHF
ncbi:hypothetical protein NCPPB1935_08085 [Xanthomonas campestris pv. nigromaculans]|nr:hypothetical protein NCPPB1935_08085 [Xanthomonas campestris pv. nigromaculans]